jgi:hypothetical protein
MPLLSGFLTVSRSFRHFFPDWSSPRMFVPWFTYENDSNTLAFADLRFGCGV